MRGRNSRSMKQIKRWGLTGDEARIIPSIGRYDEILEEHSDRSTKLATKYSISACTKNRTITLEGQKKQAINLG